MKMFVVSCFAMKSNGLLSEQICHSLEYSCYQIREIAWSEALEWHQEINCPVADGWRSHSVLVSGEITGMKKID